MPTPHHYSHHPDTRRQILALVSFLAVIFLVAIFGAQFTPGDWYTQLNKPTWTPPDWVFPLVWPVLYIMIAIAGWQVWRRFGFVGARPAFYAYSLQLFLNACWSWLFFGLQNPLLGLFDILALLIIIGFNIRLFHRADPLAGWLLVPYWLWVLYAATLNSAIVILN
ncbi:MAG: TspO/MBR family protein [Gammaproteobacteria bacterium]